MKRPELFALGFHLSHFPVPEEVREAVIKEDWQKVDDQFRILTAPEGALFKFLQAYHEFSSIEFIISIRNSTQEWEEDGIWHDDGSRLFAFSLSLTIDENLQGGRLAVRRKGDDAYLEIPTPSFGGIIMFLTGVYGFEHKIHRVTSGQRVIIAGWCS